MNGKVTVILAAYRGEKYLGEQLRSLFQQTYPPDIILIGDDSPDNLSYQAVQEVITDCPDSCKVVYHKNPTRLGFLGNFINLASQVGSDYLMFCDQDDSWLPEKIEKMTALLDSRPDCDMGFCDSFLCDRDLTSSGRTLFGLIRTRNFRDKSIHNINVQQAFPVFLTNYNFVAGHNIILRRSAIPVFLAMPLHFRYHDLWCGWVFSFLERICCLDEALTLHRLHGENVSDYPLLAAAQGDNSQTSGEKGLFSRQFAKIQRFLQSNQKELSEEYIRVKNLKAAFDESQNCLDRPAVSLRHDQLSPRVFLAESLRHAPRGNQFFLQRHVDFLKWRLRLNQGNTFVRLLHFRPSLLPLYFHHSRRKLVSMIKDFIQFRDNPKSVV